jgi:hypothetical protein
MSTTIVIIIILSLVAFIALCISRSIRNYNLDKIIKARTEKIKERKKKHKDV